MITPNYKLSTRLNFVADYIDFATNSDQHISVVFRYRIFTTALSDSELEAIL